MGYKVLYVMAFSVAAAGCAAISEKSSTIPEAPVVDMTGASSPQRPAQQPEPRAEALLTALTTLGVDYRNGGTSPITGFDCSGLVAHVFAEAYGIRLPRNTLAQSEVGLPVSLNELEPGDLVFYDTQGRPYSHVGIYIGDGRFVHAPKSGSRVRVESLRAAYWLKRFNGARRIEPAL